MSEDWSKLLDVGPLADARAHIGFSIPLKNFPRVLPLLAAPDGTADGHIGFSREGPVAVAEVGVAAEVMLLCQRCLSLLRWSVNSTGRAALVSSPAEAEQVPEELETVLALEHRISVRALVEEELLLALPLAPRHENDGCAGERAGMPMGQGAAVAPAPETHRPFGQLSELLKRQ